MALCSQQDSKGQLWKMFILLLALEFYLVSLACQLCSSLTKTNDPLSAAHPADGLEICTFCLDQNCLLCFSTKVPLPPTSSPVSVSTIRVSNVVRVTYPNKMRNGVAATKKEG